MSSVPTKPSTARWSHDIVTLIWAASIIAIAHDRALLAGADRQNGRLRRIDHGGEILDAVHAEIGHRRGAALIFVRLELAVAGAAAKSRISFEIADIDLVSALRMIGVISPFGIATATPISECLCLSMPASVQLTLASGMRCSASASALMTKSLTESLSGRLAVLALGGRGIDLLAGVEQLADVAIDRQVEMRDGLLRRVSRCAMVCRMLSCGTTS